MGAFRCGVDHARFRDSGPASDCLVVFPRTAVWIRHEGKPAFLADPTLVTIYNRGQLYERFVASPEGDRCDWFAVSDDMAREIAGVFEPAAAESERPFRFAHAASSAGLFLSQRTLVRRVAQGAMGPLEVDEAVMGIVAAVLRQAYRRPPAPLASQAAAVRRRRDLAEAARAELARDPSRNASVHEVAAAVGASPFHLCRVFRSCTGRTLHEYRRELRVRLALEPLGGENGGSSSLSRVAYRFGFANHAHFVREMRQRFGTTPSAMRKFLAPGAAPAARVSRAS